MSLTLRPIDKRDIPILRRLNSPYWQRIQAGLQGQQSADSPTEFTATEGAEILFQFSRPIREVEATLKRGRAQFRFEAARAINVSELEAKALLDRIQVAFVRFANSKGNTAI